MTRWSGGSPIRVTTTSVTSTRNRWYGPGGASPPDAPATAALRSGSVISSARPVILASPSNRAGWSGGSTVALWRARRGSRRRSRAFMDLYIPPSHRSPSANDASVPLIRGEPSLRKVAMVLWRWASNNARALPASSGAAAVTSSQVAMSVLLSCGRHGRGDGRQWKHAAPAGVAPAVGVAAGRGGGDGWSVRGVGERRQAPGGAVARRDGRDRDLEGARRRPRAGPRGQRRRRRAGQPRGPRRRRQGPVHLRRRGRRLVGRAAPARGRTGQLRGEPDHPRPGRHRRGDRRALAGRRRAAGGLQPAGPLLQARHPHGQPAVPAALRRRRPTPTPTSPRW